MTAMPHFRHHRPASLAQALALLERYQSAAQLLAGGTELVPRMRAGKLAPEHVVSLSGIGELGGLRFEAAEGLRIGAAACIREVAEHEAVVQHYPALAQACSLMATPQIRNMATVVGNLANGSPCADTAGPLLVHEARVQIEGSDGKRELPLEEFFLGPREVALGPTEIATAACVPPPPTGSRSSYLRLSPRSRVDVATASAAALVALGEDGRVSCARIAIGAVAPTPLRCLDAEALLDAKPPTPERLALAAQAAAEAARPIDHVRASAAYRLAVLPVLVRRALERCLAALGVGEGGAR